MIARRVKGLSVKTILKVIGCPYLFLYAAKGYWYFAYDQSDAHGRCIKYQTHSIMVMRLSDMPIEQWLDEGRAFARLQGYEFEDESESEDQISDKDLYGIQEIAMVAGVSSSAVNNWVRRYTSFPTPFVRLMMGPVYKGLEVRLWIKNNKGKLHASPPSPSH